MHDQTFADLGLSDRVCGALAARGITTPFPIQQLVMADALAGNDVLARSPTGSGKTLAFGLAIIDRLDHETAPRPSALVMVPTRELAAQVREELEDVAAARHLTVGAVYGGVRMGAQAGATKAHILVGTPGRLEDLASRRAVNLDDVRILVLDEADRMLDMGFQPQVDKIVRRLPRERQTMFFSATLDGEVGQLARQYTTDACRFESEPRIDAPAQVEHQFVSVTPETKVDTLVELLTQDRGLALVFVRTRVAVDRLARALERRGVTAVPLHGDMPQSERERALSRFDRGEVTTLVATDVAARGLDLDRITHVINYDPPGDMEGYVHRVGRTGRAGRAGTGVTLVTREEQADVSRIAARLDLKDEFTREGMKVAPPKLVYQSRRRSRGWR
jgi:superfamily II DNA/RNA helicase